ncbi:hypothetical protein OG874_00455 [Nocardia sp. NBC_00565]|uniref:hypothetical protein n=1 Tax=Nocardia sp. NBC_00565 TaxID=2975993 RepID=UPI002E802957|nr:hypothetical protein [Nocardia sp. NBC_00565]WUC03726.1 hypothetical protein OG874_00455 [Nocardia sp. NBC_00565]
MPEYVDGGVILSPEELEAIPTLDGSLEPSLPIVYCDGGYHAPTGAVRILPKPLLIRINDSEGATVTEES